MISKVYIYKSILEFSQGRESAHIFRFKIQGFKKYFFKMFGRLILFDKSYFN